MIPIAISEEFAEAGVRVALGCVACAVTVAEADPALAAALDAEAARRTAELAGRPVSEVPQIAAARRAYRAFGKDPARYRVSSEALMRRLIKGQGLYRINTAVDANNLISLRTGHSVGMFDAGRISPPVTFRRAGPGETYDAIGRGPMNLEALPVLADAEGPFGSPTSDSERSKVTSATTRLFMSIIAFDGDAGLELSLAWAVETLEAHCAAHGIETAIIANHAR
ncbi:MAG: phenylalanine--tRNA ligase beta subunit-related protein [Rhodospirillales bacterium]|jgi:DNA/RNA-binding domain of Phe-tRNA-synthetase-like protein|nr:phenylalanine--tRNA ligase beta subunit-related protein [Rhodospirillales bacterium]